MPTARYSTAKDQQIIVVCDSVSVATGDIAGVLSSLRSLSGDRSSAMSAEGTVTLVFDGYDDDPRELEAIPEVRKWFARLYEAWPYWSFFASRVDQTVPLVLTLLMPGETVAGEPGMVGWEYDPDELRPLLLELFMHQNELVERLEIGEDVNERASGDFIEAVQAFL